MLDNVGKRFLQNFVAYLPIYTALRPRKYSNIHAYRHYLKSHKKYWGSIYKERLLGTDAAFHILHFQAKAG
jgi:hypothetical protein